VKSLNIFRAGKHTDSKGVVREFTAEQLKAAVAAYDPQVHEAPITIGHSDSAAPAYAWIGNLKLDGTDVNAEPIQVDAQFAEMVKAGRFKKVSAAWWLPDEPTNPKPGVYYLHHVAFLGAQPPAVKGLRQVEFGDKVKGVAEFVDWSEMNIARLLRSLKNFLIAQFGQEQADRALPEYDVDSAISAAATAPNPTAGTLYQEHSTMKPEELALKQEQLAAAQDKLKKDQEKLDADRAEFAERTRQLTEQERVAQLRTHVDFCDGLVKAGKLLPAHKQGMVAFMASISSSGVIEFGEGDKKQSKPQLAWFQEYLAAQPKVVELREHGGGDEPLNADGTKAKDFAAKAAKFQEDEKAAGRVVSIAEAMTHVTRQAQ
jgi:hypothetical protein